MVESVDLWLENHLAFGDDSFGLFDAVSDDNNATRMPNAKQFDDIFNMPIGQNKNGDEDLFPESLTFDEEGKELLEVEYQATPLFSEWTNRFVAFGRFL
mmetsp:Transcript_37485/g.118224  ORF Transcript_37485/g.118224 Transcript_37485/m.118224 type:complete len:99 (+) Transcript_37485:246-542(+)